MLDDIKGIGPKTIKILNKLGIKNKYDLVNYYPFRYDILEKSNLDNLIQDDKIIIDGIVENIPNVFYFNKKMNKMMFRLNIEARILNITIFNRAFLKSKLTIGTKVIVIGKYDQKHNTVVATDIRFGLLSSEPKIEPIYHCCNGISSFQIHNYIESIIKDFNVDNLLPDYLIDKYQFLSKKECLQEIHNPTSINKLKRARIHLKYEELFLFMLKINNLKKNSNYYKGLERNVSYDDIQLFIDKLPFKLTSDQLESVNKIYKDLVSSKRMNRLLQGDVGSGKTVVAIISLYINYLSGYQGALMAPTEVLALQHYENIKELLPDINIAFLSGNTKSREKKKIINNLQQGKIDIIVGTHSLFSDDVLYYNLGLVITDEQHRFGVVQRSSLKNKGITPDVLYLSATPIPRTYALTIYGDMDISSIKTRPFGRKEIITYVKKSNQIKEVLSMMLEQIKEGHQVYVIAPVIEDNDNSELESAEALYTKINRAFSKICNIGLLHGKMNKEEKEEVMNKFKNNDISILISTTVIEVGVDVKNATMMVIFDSYRFGLSTLHQLRGRVGRNQLQSYCILISDKEAARLDVMTKTNDGFKISEEDFKLRGSGDIFGIKQSGDMNFNIADIKQDFNILTKAKEDVEKFLEEKDINEYPHLKAIINKSVNLD